MSAGLVTEPADRPVLAATDNGATLVHAVKSKGGVLSSVGVWSSTWCGLAIQANYVEDAIDCRRCNNALKARKKAARR